MICKIFYLDKNFKFWTKILKKNCIWGIDKLKVE